MGVRYIYSCDYCNNFAFVDIAPFDVTDPGESTPTGWLWQFDDETLKCLKCKGDVPG